MALWMYNLLASCNSVKQLENNKEKYYNKMHPTDLHYLTKLLTGPNILQQDVLWAITFVCFQNWLNLEWSQ
jgi:hypothetical protein